MISLFKISGPFLRTILTNNYYFPNSNYSHKLSLMERLKMSRIQNEFDIIITLNDSTESDNGNYSAVADVRSPPNRMRVCMYKNFTLTVSESKS